MAGELPEFRRWLLDPDENVCVVCGGGHPNEVNHATGFPTYAPGSKPDKVIEGKRGKSQKAHDYYGMPVHLRCHRHFHDLSGPFSGWDRERLRTWQEETIRELHERYDAYVARHNAASDPTPEALPVAAPSWDVTRELAEGLDAKRVSSRFAKFYSLSGQAALDLERLLQAFMSARSRRRTG